MRRERRAQFCFIAPPPHSPKQNENHNRDNDLVFGDDSVAAIDACPAVDRCISGRKPSPDRVNRRTLDPESWEVPGEGGGSLKNTI